jgi:formylglycine-generating enzyme required for sulfatase activity
LALGRNPYMLVMLAQVYAAQQRLPQNRGRLFAAFVATLLAREEKRCDPAHWPGTEALRQALAQLAYAMQQAGERGTALDESWATAQIAVAGCRAADLLYLATSATLLEWQGGTVRFIHQLVQEYFAAVALHNAWQAGADLRAYWSQGWSTPSGWEESFVLLAGLMPDLTPLVEALLPVHPPLAARCIATSGGPLPAPATQAQVQQTLVKLATGPQVPLAQRIAAGEALNHLGDPRPGVGLTSAGLPDLVWSPVAAGVFWMGNTKATDVMAYGNESPQHRLHLPAFAISQYPITNSQYAAFVHDGGYQTQWQHCWTVDGWQWRVENSIDNPQRYGDPYDLPNHPVVGVSWYEALAFCAWLSHQLGRTVRLPSEAEWEKAARGANGRRYPWGDKLTREHANYAETGSKSTSVVGIFPKGASPSGALDMAGNVWEWTSSLFKDYPYDPNDGREDPAAAARRVVRGDSFVFNLSSVRSAVRYRSVLDLRRYNDVGFRVVAPGS